MPALGANHDLLSSGEGIDRGKEAGRRRRVPVAADDPPFAEDFVPDEAAEELRHANEIFAKEKFGEIEGRPVWPFSQQLKNDIELHFSIDSRIFTETNSIQFGIYWKYILLRSLTFGLFLCWLTVVAAAVMSAHEVSFQPVWLANLIERYDPFPVAICALLAAGLLRLVFRQIYFWVVGLQVDTWASHVIRNHADIVNRIQTCCTRILTRTHISRDYPLAAKNWMKVALFNAKRVEYLDRHTTTTKWKINQNLVEIECWFRAFKALSLLGLLFYVWSPTIHQSASWVPALLPGPQMSLTDAGFSIVVVFGTILVFDYLGRQSNDLWGQKFVERFNEAHVPKEHYFEQLGNTVLAIVSQLIARDLNHI